MNEENFVYDMYGSGSPITKKQEVSPAKLASRVLGGMKAQNSHTKTIEVDGQIVNLPKAEYVKLLEDQIKDMRNKVRDMETKQNRLSKTNARIIEELRQIKLELANKLDVR